MKTEILTITPDLAKNLLSNNKSNRRIDSSKLLFIVHQIENGQWKLNGESIIISNDGEILDGQHRLSAVVKTGKSIGSLLVSGIDKNVFDTIDTGKARSAADVLYIMKTPNSTGISGGINKYLMLCKGYQSSTMNKAIAKISNTDIKDEYLNNEELYQNLHKAASAFYHKNFRIITIGDYIGFYRLFQLKHSTNVVQSFFDAIDNRDGIGDVLYNKLLNDIVAKRKMISSEKNAIIIKAFNAHVSGKVVKVLKYSIEESFPKVA